MHVNILKVILLSQAYPVIITLNTHSPLNSSPTPLAFRPLGPLQPKSCSSQQTYMTITATHLLHFDGTDMETSRHFQARRWIPLGLKNTLFYCSIPLEQQARMKPAGFPHQRSSQPLTLLFPSCHHQLAKAVSPSKTGRNQTKSWSN